MQSSSLRDAVLQFLSDVHSASPHVQAQNITTLNTLATHRDVIPTLVTIISDDATAHSATVRITACTVARRVLTSFPSSAAAAPTTIADAIRCVELLFQAMDSACDNRSLQRSIASLLASLVASFSSSSDVVATDSLWTFIITEALLGRCRSTAGDDGTAMRTASAALRVLSEDAAEAMRRGIGESVERCAALCNVLAFLITSLVQLAQQQAQVLGTHDAREVFVKCVADIYTALGNCLAHGILPRSCPVGMDSQDGPAAAALQRTVSHVASLLASFAHAMEGAMLPLLSVWLQGGDWDHSAALLEPLLHYLNTTEAEADVDGTTPSSSNLLQPITTAILSLWRASVAHRPTSPMMERMLVASLAFLAEAAHTAADGSSTTFDMMLPDVVNGLFDLSVLPHTVTHSAKLEWTAQEPDTEADVRVAVRTNRAEKHNHNNNNNNKSDHDDGSCSEDDMEDGGGSSGLRVESLLDDNGTRRDAIAWLLNCIAMRCSLEVLGRTLIIPGVQSVLSSLDQSANPDSLPAAEAALFLIAEVVDEVSLGDGSEAAVAVVNALCSLAAALVARLSASMGGTPAVPFYVRLQAVTVLTRIATVVVNSEEEPHGAADGGYLCTAALAQAMHPGTLLIALAQLVAVDGNKMVVIGAIQNISFLVNVCLTKQSLAAAETISEDSDDDDYEDVDCGSASHAASCTIDWLGTCTSTNNGDAPLSRSITTVMSVFSGMQLGPRTAVYHLLNHLFPLMASAQQRHAVVMDPVMVSTVLETLAQQFMRLVNDPSSSSSSAAASASGLCAAEAASVLNTLCDVAASVGELLLPALSWLVQVFVHVTQCFVGDDCNHHHGAAVSVPDMCMLACDLLSCACDALLDRDTLAAATIPQSAAVDDVAVVACQRRLEALASAFTVDTVVAECFSLLSKCRTAKKVHTNGGDAEDDLSGELRRAVFGLLYDCVYLHARCIEEVGVAVLSQCFAELYDDDDGGTAALGSGNGNGQLALGSAAASNALLCIAEVLYLSNNASNTIMYATYGLAFQHLSHSLMHALSNTHANTKELVVLDRHTRLNACNALLASVAYVCRVGDPASLFTLPQYGALLRVSVTEVVKVTPKGPAAQYDSIFECTQLLHSVASIIATLNTHTGRQFLSTGCGVVSSNTTAGAADVDILQCVAKYLSAAYKCINCLPRKQGVLLSVWQPIAQVMMQSPQWRGDALRTIQKKQIKTLSEW